MHAFCIKHAPDKTVRKRLIAQLHKGRYGEEILKELPPADMLNPTARAFFGMGKKAASRFSAEDLITASAVAAATAAANAAASAQADVALRTSSARQSSNLEIPDLTERVPEP